MKPRPPIRTVAIQIPALAIHAADAIIDLLGQLQGALWDSYGAAIVDRLTERQLPLSRAGLVALAGVRLANLLNVPSNDSQPDARVSPNHRATSARSRTAPRLITCWLL